MRLLIFLRNFQKLKENMDFENLSLRIFTSIILISLVMLSLIYLDAYLPFIALVIYLLVFYEVLNNFKRNHFFFIFINLYLLVSLVCLELYLFYYFNKEKFFLFLMIIIFFDIFSYFFGKLFGRKKILPNISPNKTYFGFFSGLIITVICSQLLNYYLKIYNSYEIFIFAVLFILSTFLGDVIESYYKRISNIKDSGNLLPGHGGFFDRFDSFILCTYGLILFTYVTN